MSDQSRDVTLRERLRYRIDNALSRGVTIVLVWVFAGLCLLVVAVASIMWFQQIGPRDAEAPFAEGLWISLTRALDPGTFGQDEGPRFRLATLIVTLGGILAVALVIGLISNAIDRRLDELRRGRSVVVEKGHTLILGYSGKLPIVVQELIEANASSHNAAIVILTRNDKVGLEELLKRQLVRLGSTRVVVRRGDPASLTDLEQVKPRDARAVVILRPDEDAADARVVRVVLAIRKVREGLPQVPIVAELSDGETARALRQALPGMVTTVVSKEVVARIAAQTSRGPGLGTVYEEFLNFSGDELYIIPAPNVLRGRTFGEAMLSSPTSTLIGVVDAAGVTHLCPDFSRVIRPDDSVIVVAEDDSTIVFLEDFPAWTPQPDVRILHAERSVERTLIIGWNRIAPRIAQEFDHHVLSGSQLHVLIDPIVPEDFKFDQMTPLVNQELHVSEGSTIDRDVILEALARGPFNHIMVLCTYDALPAVESDARALLTLMHIRNALDAAVVPVPDFGRMNVITEVMESQSVELAQVARPDDFIVSQRLVSLMIAQLVENPARKLVIEEILGSDGAQINLHLAARYVAPGTYTFLELVESTREHGVVLLGWRSTSHAGLPGYLVGGLRMNPAKGESVVLEPGDALVVLIET